jgi:hypothetical protein
MGQLADEIRRRSAVADEELSHADTAIREARIVADLAFETAALVGLTLDRVVDQLTQLERELKKLRNAPPRRRKPEIAVSRMPS